MKRMLTALWLPMALSLAIAAGAAPKQQTDQNQGYGQSSQTGQSGQTGTMDNGRKVTLTGCLQAGTEPNTWILTNATTSSAKSTRNNQAPSEMARAESSYVLVPENGIDLSKHVGHRVRVTGNIEEGSSSTSPSTSNTGSSSMGSTGTTGTQSSANMTRFDVRTIKHVSNTCQ